MANILIHIVQLIGIVVPFIGCISLLRRVQSRTSIYLLLANLGCLIINGSYLLLLRTETYDGALAALKMEYFGNVVFYLMFAMFLWSYLKIKGHKWIKILFGFWGIQDMVFLFFVWIGNMQNVFTSLEFRWNERLGLVLIQAVPDTLYMVHYCIICLVLFCGMIYTSVRLFRVKVKSERYNLARLAGAQFVICASLILMLMCNFSFDIVPVCTSLSILSIIVSVLRDEFFGVTELGQQWVFEQMEDAFVIVDGMYGYLEANAYAKKVFSELNRKRKNEIISDELRALFTDNEKIQQIQGKYYNKKIMEIREKGEVSGYSLFLADITEQYELMERVREEKERADAANQAKSAFVSNVSHEIRTPMNAIVGMTQIMLRGELSKQQRDYLLNIRNSGDALLTIINDLLDMSKIESGKMELVDEEYDFMSMLSDLGMIILNRIGNKPIELLFDIDADIPSKLYGDALRIRQIIINLMNNATKFTEEGYVCLTVKVKQIEDEDIELYLSVRDSGQGIREEDLGKLFGTFQQVDTKKNHHKEGTGLGLSISKQLVELMHGRIGVNSEYGKGSEFYFTIHQRIMDGTRAAQITDEQQAVVIGGMKNPVANELLKKLAAQYQLNFAENIMAVEKADASVFYFTDRYGELGSEEQQRLAEYGAVVCGMVNPMIENDLPKDMFTMNKPLFSYNFCNFIENRENRTDDRKDGAGTDQAAEYPEEFLGEDSQTPEEPATEFEAPDAKVLIVDDNEINRMVAEEMLKPLRMQIETASDGKHALEMIKDKKYDLIFMDHLMPVMDGVEAVTELRKLEEPYYKNVPVIALTANTAKEQREEYIRAGMSDFLSKPIDLGEIYKIVKKWIPDKILSGT
ncbi:MAG: response regulator [Lachnospiraceae bacterium]|nr:response regulator [Lachnospiraceae bacterium]MBD5481457.1 response regulator [Lachnospiraceae bacterium]